ncbi:MAG: hypothetical protein M1401_04495 [Chloroflexi bacterium]|nr:hypothetical protein [Chloroflexota bacterium]MCL5108111.1 hypothetical protein [Chloroflexota bacterium]
MLTRRLVAALALVALLFSMLEGVTESLVAAAAPEADITSGVALMNRSSSATASWTAHFFNTDGSEATDPSDLAPISGTLGPQKLASFAMPGWLPSGWQGSVVIESDQELSAIVNYYSPSENTSSYVYGTVNGFDSPRTGSPLFLPFILRERSGRNTAFGIQNAGSASAAVTIEYRDTSGAVRKTLNPTLAPGQSAVRHQYSDDSDLGGGFMGFVIATSSQPLAGSVNDYGQNILYTYPASAKPETNLYMPFMVRNRSNQNTAYLLLNANASSTSVQVIYSGSTSSNPNVSVVQSRTLGPWEAWNLGQASVPGLPDGFLGSARVVASQPVVAIVNHSYGAFSDAGRKTTYLAVGDSQVTKNAALPFVLRNRSNKQQGIIIQNIDNVDTRVTLSFVPTSGGTAQTYTQTVGPYGFWNFGTGYAQFAGLGDGFYGTATITSDTGRIVALVNTWNDTVGPDSLGTYTGFNY